VTSVPKMGTKPPNCSVTGFHSVLVMKPSPNLWNAGAAPMASDTTIAVSIPSTNSAKSCDSRWNTASCRASRAE
jgi:hypothetical protein